MIHNRFSSDVFLKENLDAEDLEVLTQLLASEIQQEIHEAIKDKFEEIIEELNQVGHALRVYGEQGFCDISYRDDWEDESGYHCKLRIAFCGIVSVGCTNPEI